MVTVQEISQSYNANRMPNPNQPKGEVRLIAEKMALENPFLPQQIIAKVLKVSEARIGQICKAMAKEREAAQKEELKRLRERYLK